MPVIKTIRLILTFYRSFFLAAAVLTAACGFLFFTYHFSIVGAVLGFKIATNALVWYFINSFKAQEFYYYQNLGLSKRWLWSVTLSIDFVLFFLTLFTIHYNL